MIEDLTNIVNDNKEKVSKAMDNDKNNFVRMDRSATDEEKIIYGNRFYELYQNVDKYKISDIPQLIQSLSDSILGLQGVYIDTCSKYQLKPLDIFLSNPLQTKTSNDKKEEEDIHSEFDNDIANDNDNVNIESDDDGSTVTKLLNDIGMDKYYKSFVENELNDIDVLKKLTNEHLQELRKIDKLKF